MTAKVRIMEQVEAIIARQWLSKHICMVTVIQQWWMRVFYAVHTKAT
jgi:hypothetical protein